MIHSLTTFALTRWNSLSAHTQLAVVGLVALGFVWWVVTGAMKDGLGWKR